VADKPVAKLLETRLEPLWEHGCQQLNASGLDNLYAGNMEMSIASEENVNRGMTGRPARTWKMSKRQH
jgi:hypothetical protein